jgi:hypothetical protein
MRSACRNPGTKKTRLDEKKGMGMAKMKPLVNGLRRSRRTQ